MSDLISRNAAIDLLATMQGRCTSKAALIQNSKIWQQIKALPSAQRWIPVSEGPPKANGRYLVTRGLNACGALWNRVYIINYSDLMGLKSERIWWDGNVGKSDFEEITDVLAWKPLPEPWKGGRGMKWEKYYS